MLAQVWQEPGAAPPGGNTPGVIWNSQISGSQQNASFNVGGTGRTGGGAAFGGFTPDALWMVTSPNAYFGNGVAGTIIGAGGGQNAGDIRTDGNLYVIGRSGIGTASPGISTQLQVAGMGLFTGGTYNPGDGTPAGTEIGFNTVSNYGFVQPVTTGVTWWPLALNPGGGNVGIGTTAPASNLDIQGIGTSAYIRIGGVPQTNYTGLALISNSGEGQIWKNGTGYGGYGGARAVNIYNSEDFPIAFFQGVSERMRINSGGNVGIGTTAPGSRLDVAGNINSSGDVTGSRLCIGADCRNAWPVPGGGGDITAVNAGTGMTGGGLAGDVTLSLDATHNDGSAFDSRFVNVSGDTMTGLFTAAAVGISLGGVTRTTWPTDSGGDITDVTAGNGLIGGGSSGNVTLNVGTGVGIAVGADVISLDTTYTDSRYINTTGDTLTGPLSGTVFTALGDVSGSRLCIGVDCRVAWPVGGGGDITAVNAGTGLFGGGLSGDVTLNLNTGYTDGLYVKKTGDTMTGDLTLSGGTTDLYAGGGISIGGASLVAGELRQNGSYIYIDENSDAVGSGISFFGAASEVLVWKPGFTRFEFSDDLRVGGNVDANGGNFGGSVTAINGTFSGSIATNGATLNATYGINAQGDYGARALGNGAGTSYGVYGETNNGTTRWSGYFLGLGIAPYSNVYVGDNLLVGSTSEAINDSGFSLNGNDAYVSGDLGVNGELHLDGDIRFGTVTLGSCDSSLRGTLRYEEGGAGVKDRLVVCAKDAAGAYGWRTLY